MSNYLLREGGGKLLQENGHGILLDETPYSNTPHAKDDIIPINVNIKNNPINMNWIDVKTLHTVVLGAGMPLGPGFFLYLTYPVSITVTY